MAQTLLRHGWTDVRPMLGGFDEWRKAGYPTEAKSTESRPLTHVTDNGPMREPGDDDRKQ